MAQELSTTYDVRHFDAEGNEMNPERRRLQRYPLPPGMTRGDFFHQTAAAAGAADYTVHLMRPDEIKTAIKEERKARGEDFISQVLRTAGRIAGLDNLAGMIAYLDSSHDQQLTGIQK